MTAKIYDERYRRGKLSVTLKRSSRCKGLEYAYKKEQFNFVYK